MRFVTELEIADLRVAGYSKTLIIPVQAVLIRMNF
jgi:hypothetical protein